jgi:predicted PurR-regulated permease PerM
MMMDILPPARSSRAQVVSDVGRTLGAYLRGQLIIAGILTVIYLVGFAAIGVPLWPVAAVLAGMFNVIPLVGSLIGVLIPVIFLLFGNGGWVPVVQVVGLFLAAQALEGLYLSPKILGGQLSLRPVVVFLVVLLGGFLFGPVGALAAAPFTAIVLLLRRKWLDGRAAATISR